MVVQNSYSEAVIQPDVYRCFSALYTNPGITLQIKPLPLYYTFFHRVIQQKNLQNLPVYFELSTDILKKPQIYCKY